MGVGESETQFGGRCLTRHETAYNAIWMVADLDSVSAGRAGI